MNEALSKTEILWPNGHPGEEVENVVRWDLAKLDDIQHPSQLVLHNIAVTADEEGPSVDIWGLDGEDSLVAVYNVGTEWEDPVGTLTGHTEYTLDSVPYSRLDEEDGTGTLFLPTTEGTIQLHVPQDYSELLTTAVDDLVYEMDYWDPPEYDDEEEPTGVPTDAVGDTVDENVEIHHPINWPMVILILLIAGAGLYALIETLLNGAGT